MDGADGLLRAGPPGVQLTWMDAKVGDWVVTPRIGKPVEINALWYNALRVMSVFAAAAGQADRFGAPADAAKRSFARFVRADGEGLYDVIDGPDGDDASIRPNQIFAVSLPHSPLAADDQARVVRAAGVTFSPRSGCARWRPAARPTIRVTAAVCSSATAAIIRGRSGAGYSDRSASPTIALAATRPRRK